MSNPRIDSLQALYDALDRTRAEWPELTINVLFVGDARAAQVADLHRRTRKAIEETDDTRARLSKHAQPRPRRPMSEKGRRSIRRMMKARWRAAKAAGRNHI